MRFSILIVLLYPMTALAQSSVTGSGTATVDGRKAPGEWGGAARVEFLVRGAHGRLRAATLFLMSDDSNFYALLEVVEPATFLQDASWELRFDGDNDGQLAHGDDALSVSSAGFSDRVLLRNPLGGGGLLPIPDTVSQDGEGARSPNTAETTVFELSHPLSSGDTSDFDLAPGDVVGLLSRFNACSDCADDLWPSESGEFGQFGVLSAAEPSFTLEFDGPNPDGKSDVRVDSVLHTSGIPDGEPGTQGWTLSIAEGGDCQIFYVTTQGTAVELIDDGFVQYELTSGDDNEGLIMACVLSFSQPVTLLPEDSPHRLVGFRVGPRIAGCGSCELAYRDGLRGAITSAENLITRRSVSYRPDLTAPLDFEVCGCFPSESLPPLWQAHDLGGAQLGSSRAELASVFELCSDAAGYGDLKDEVRLVHHSLLSSAYFSTHSIYVAEGFEMRVRVDEISPDGTAGIEIRGGTAFDTDASRPRFAFFATREGNVVRLRVSSRQPGEPATTSVLGGAIPLPVTLRIRGIDDNNPPSFGPRGIQAGVTDLNGVTTWFQSEFETPAGYLYLGLAQASGGGQPAQARFCVLEMSGFFDGDADGDGCRDCVDEDPTRAYRLLGRSTGPCCENVLQNYYKFEGVDTDGDGLLDCEDPDDDNDGVLDAEDSCRHGPPELCKPEGYCCDLGDWVDLCRGDCGPYFAVVRPEETGGGDPIVFDRFEVINEALYLTPPDGMSAADVAKVLHDYETNGGPADGGGAGAAEVRLEIWERRFWPQNDVLVADVGSFPLEEFDLDDLRRGRYVYFAPPAADEFGRVAIVWSIGEPPSGIERADLDHDGVPDTLDNCLRDANPSQEDENQNGIGDACEQSFPPEGMQVPGDGNQDGTLDVSDVVHLLLGLFGTGVDLPCGGGLEDASVVTLLDSNGDAAVDIADPVFVLQFLFRGGASPALGLECVPIAGCTDACAGQDDM